MDLWRIIINKEVIIQKLFSNKTNVSTNKGAKEVREEVKECKNPTNKTLPITEKTLTRLIKTTERSTNNWNRLWKYKRFLPSKNLKKNKSYSNKEDHEDVHQWLKWT